MFFVFFCKSSFFSKRLAAFEKPSILHHHQNSTSDTLKKEGKNAVNIQGSSSSSLLDPTSCPERGVASLRFMELWSLI